MKTCKITLYVGSGNVPHESITVHYDKMSRAPDNHGSWIYFFKCDPDGEHLTEEVWVPANVACLVEYVE